MWCGWRWGPPAAVLSAGPARQLTGCRAGERSRRTAPSPSRQCGVVPGNMGCPERKSPRSQSSNGPKRTRGYRA